MNVKYKHDIYGRTEPATIYLAKPGKRIYCALNGIDSSSASITIDTNNTAELSFTVNKYIDENTISNAYDDIDEMMELYCNGIWFKIVDPPTIDNDGIKETKQITAESYEIGLSQYTLNNFKINTGEEDSCEMLYKREYDLNCKDNPNHDPDFDSGKYFQVTLYNKEVPDLSLLDLILKYAEVPDWKIGFIDDTISDNESEKDKLLKDYIFYYDVDDKSVYTFLTQEVSSACRCVFVFDSVNMTINAYRPEGLGKDTGVFVGFRNIQNNITTTRDSSLITRFNVSGMSDYGIDSVNFGDSGIYDYSYFAKEPYMNSDMQKKYTAWNEYRESKREDYMRYSKIYNTINEKLSELTNRVPVDTASNDWFSSSVNDLKNAYNSNVAIIRGLESMYIDDNDNFDIEELKKHTDDWNLYESIMNYTFPSIIAALQSKGEDAKDAISEINQNFKSDKKFEKFIINGNGNLLYNVNPVIIGTDWKLFNRIYTVSNTQEVSGLPYWGITRGFIFSKKPQDESDNNDDNLEYDEDASISTSDGYSIYSVGIQQSNISVTPETYYKLSCYIKSADNCTFSLGYASTGKVSSQGKSFTISEINKWNECHYCFKTEKDFRLLDVVFLCSTKELDYLPLSICGMQLEEISESEYNQDAPATTFGYFIESDDSIKSYETDWDLYGIDELEVKIKTYQNCIKELKKQGYTSDSKIGDVESGYAGQMKQNCRDYEDLLLQAQNALKERQSEYESLKSKTSEVSWYLEETDKDGNFKTYTCTAVNGMDGANANRKYLAEDVKISNWGKNWDNEWNDSAKDPSIKNNLTNAKGTSFTDEELRCLRILTREASYSNENIDITDIDTTVTAIDQANKLYLDAIDQLYVESHPQYVYTDNVENIYALPEFNNYHEKLGINDYIYVGIDDRKYIKLRLTKISFNPCDLDESMTITFSNMIQYKSKRNDYNSLIENLVNKSSHDAGQITGKSDDASNYVINAAIIKQLFSNPLFSLKNSTDTSSMSSSDVVSRLLAASERDFSDMTTSCGLITSLDKKYVTSDLIVRKLVNQTLSNINITASALSVKDEYKIYDSSYNDTPLSIIKTKLTDTTKSILFQLDSNLFDATYTQPLVKLNVVQENNVSKSNIDLQADEINIKGVINLKSDSGNLNNLYAKFKELEDNPKNILDSAITTDEFNSLLS